MTLPSSTSLLRAAALVSLLFALGHMSGYPWTPGESAEAGAVVDHMHSVSFEAVGAQRSYWDFYLGFGLLVGAGLAVVAALLWCSARLERQQPGVAAAPAACALVFMAVNAWLSYRYFFAIPTALAVTTMLILAVALVRMRKRETASP